MRSRVATSIWIGALVLATSASLAIKATLPRTSKGDLSATAAEAIRAQMRARGFAVLGRPHHFQSELFIGLRGKCVIAARDAQNGANDAGAFRAQMAPIGQVRYLYRGERSRTSPELRVLADGFVARNLDRFGMHVARSMPVALATGAGCSDEDFGLDQIVVTPS